MFKFTLSLFLSLSILVSNNFAGFLGRAIQTDFTERVPKAIFSDAGLSQNEKNPAELPSENTVPEKNKNDEQEKDDRLKNLQSFYNYYLHFAAPGQIINAVLSGNLPDTSFALSFPLYLLIRVFRI